MKSKVILTAAVKAAKVVAAEVTVVGSLYAAGGTARALPEVVRVGTILLKPLARKWRKR